MPTAHPVAWGVRKSTRASVEASPLFWLKTRSRGLEVDGILEFLGSSLVGPGQAGRIGLQIDLHLAVSGDVARFLVIGEVVAVDLVEAGGIAAVENDADVVQFGAAIQLELLETAGLDGEQSSLAVGLGELKSVGGLLDVDSDLVGNFLEDVAEALAGVEIRSCHDRGEQHGNHGQPASKAVDGQRHAGFSLAEVAGREWSVA